MEGLPTNPQGTTPVPRARVFRFGIFELDTQSGELRRHGQKVRLPDQAFQILQRLLDCPGEVVTREELRRELWTPDTFVDFDVGLNSAIRKLREALDDSAENPRFVETLPRRGYRFITPIRSTPTDRRPLAGMSEVPRSRSHLPPGWIAAGLALAATIALAFVYALGWWQPRAGTAPGSIRSLAVLPFENLTGDPGQEYFVDGVTDALTTDLAQGSGLNVISRTSAMQYKRAKKPLRAIGQELDVDAVLEGAIVRSGEHVRITAQLIHAASDRHLWARSYEGELSDIFALQQQISRAIMAAIDVRPAMQPLDRASGIRTVSPAAYDAYLKGVHVAGRETYEGFRTAVAFFEDAVVKQPDFAPALAAMAQAQLQFLYVGPLSPRETIPKAEAAARKALQLDDTLVEAHRTLGTILNVFYWQWEDGGKELRRARQLAAKFGDTRATPATVLIQDGRFEEAASRVHKLDEVAFQAFWDTARSLRAKGQYARAVEGFRKALEVDPERPRGHFELGLTFVIMGRLDE